MTLKLFQVIHNWYSQNVHDDHLLFSVALNQNDWMLSDYIIYARELSQASVHSASVVTKSSFFWGNFKHSSRGSENEICNPPQNWQYCKYGSWLTTGQLAYNLFFSFVLMRSREMIITISDSHVFCKNRSSF